MPKKSPSKKQPKKLPYKGWTPMKDGVSQSLLQKFRVDRDRFHKHTVLGMREVDRKEAMEYGTIFHKLIEVGASMGNRYTRAKIVEFMSKWLKTRFTAPESLLQARIAIAEYHEYQIGRASC